MPFIGNKPSAVPLTSADITDGIITVADIASGTAGLVAWQSVQTTGFTAVKGRGYPCNTTTAGFTVTLPATPSAGDEVIILDYAGTFDTNALTINPNGGKIEGGIGSQQLTGEREGVRLVYIDSTQGWLAYSGINEGTDALSPEPYSVDFLVIAGGGSGGSNTGAGGGAGGYRNSYSTETSGGGGSSEASLSFNQGTVYTITVGAGGASVNGSLKGISGVDSSISGTGISTITSIGGGGGGASFGDDTGLSGGSGGGGSNAAGGSGTANQGFSGENNANGGGGGGAGEAGGTDGSAQGGDGLASSITGSSVERAGGGGGRGLDPTPSGGAGGGGQGAGDTGTPTNGTVNTGGGGGGTRFNTASGSGGKGVVILRMLTANYSGTTTGSPTVGTDGTDTILTFNDSGSYTG